MRRLLAMVLFATICLGGGVGCQKKNEQVAQAGPIGNEIVTEEQKPAGAVEEKKSVVQVVEPGPRKQIIEQPMPRGKVKKGSLDHLDRDELTPGERDQFPADVVAVLPGDAKSTITSLAFSPDCKRLVVANARGIVEFWDLTGAKPKLQGNLQLEDINGRASKLAFSRDGAWMASLHGIPGKLIMLWQLSPDGDVRQASSVEFPRADNLAFHPSSKMLAVAANNNGEVLNITAKGFERSALVFPGANSGLNFSEDGSSFASVVFNMARNGTLYGSEVKVWSIADNRVQETHLIQQDRTIKEVALSPDKRYLATAALDMKVRIWDLGAKPPSVRADFAMPTWLKNLEFTSDGAYLLGVGSGGHVMLWNVAKSREEKKWQFLAKKPGGVAGPFAASALAPDDRHVAISTVNRPVTFILRLPIKK